MKAGVSVAAEDTPDIRKVLFGGCFINRDAHRMLVDGPEVHPVPFGGLQDFLRALITEGNTDGIERELARRPDPVSRCRRLQRP